MTDPHPITPPPELVEQRWNNSQSGGDFVQEFATFFARWGADLELEACCAELRRKVGTFSVAAHLGAQLRSDEFRTARRPKQPTPKELALLELADVYGRDKIDDVTYDTIRVALEALPK